MESAPEILTIGHSTHDGKRFLGLLDAHEVELLCDVRRFPGSRRHPQFNAAVLGATLAGAGIDYKGLGDQLGGRRRSRKRPGSTRNRAPSYEPGGDPRSAHAGWRSPPFRAYAEHMATAEFAAGLERLEALARERRAVIMCAEGDWRRCHRRLISDALAARGWRVMHIRPDGRLERHELTPFAAPGEGRVSYPAQE